MKTVAAVFLYIVGALALAVAPQKEVAKLGTVPNPTMVVELPDGELLEVCGASYDVTSSGEMKCLTLKGCTVLFNDGLESPNAAKVSPLCS